MGQIGEEKKQKSKKCAAGKTANEKIQRTSQRNDFRDGVHNRCLRRDLLTSDGVTSSQIDDRNLLRTTDIFAHSNEFVGLERANAELDAVGSDRQRRIDELRH